ncbi:MAG TPA: mannose-1-phosphate guanylyltransferase/mannose-6-phosphate isomerase, partial [Candidatus Omnitrophota bacterium]|nr:mannose-1-phosphate guanylyltransferase/mannose-6-phosphate isomerase [Candidatus Omnitrophota bacterium]
MIYPVILSGGVGSRLWPLSRSLSPKQFLPLAGERTMIQETARRVQGERFHAPIVICNHEHRFQVAEQMRQVGCDPTAIVLEPMGRNTAPAAAIGALLAGKDDPDAVVVLLPSDHLILAQDVFVDAVDKAVAAARAGALVTFGIKASAPETGYGYILKGEELPGCDGCRKVARFVEKPDRATAEGYVASGQYCWNSGMFVFAAGAFLAELEKFEPAMLAACRAALAEGKRDLDFLRLDEAAFAGCPSKSIDYAVMERTDRAAVVPADMRWSDVGSWGSLWDIADKDEAG